MKRTVTQKDNMTEHPLYITPNWPLTEVVHAGTTITAHAFASKGFNLAQHVNDSLARVRDNRARLMAALGAELTPMWLSQVHGNTVIHANHYQFPIEADAGVSDQAQAMPIVMTADCLPIVLSDDTGEHVAAIHAGWPGLYKAIIANTIANMPCAGHRLYAWIGPAISQENYEVDAGFYRRFCELNADYSVYFKQNRAQHYLADLVGIARNQLQACGLKSDHIYQSHLCSYADKRFFSHRRDGMQSGRMATFILSARRA